MLSPARTRNTTAPELSAPKRVLLLPGDGIGYEVVAAARQVLDALRPDVTYANRLVGAAALREVGRPFEDDLIDVAREHDAIFFGAVGGWAAGETRWDRRPEAALFALRRELDLFANVRPIRSLGRQLHARTRAPLDLLIVRELTGGLYFGEKFWEDGVAVDTCRYSEADIERVVRVAFTLAQQRNLRLTSVDKANILITSLLWRSVVERVAQEFPEVSVEMLLADNAALQLIVRPASFDVIVTDNLFGDILSDEAAGLVGGLGVAPSVSFGSGTLALYEPCHGTAPDIAGKGIANPIAAILCAAMMLERSLGDPVGARAIESAVSETVRDGVVTPDLGGVASTAEVTEAVIERLGDSARGYERVREERAALSPVRDGDGAA